MVCCEKADEELLEHEPGLFNCETCPVWQRRDALSRANLLALETFDRLNSRSVVDFGLQPLVFDAMRLRLTQDEALLLLDSLDVIYDVRCPVKRPNG